MDTTIRAVQNSDKLQLMHMLVTQNIFTFKKAAFEGIPNVWTK